MYCVEKKKDINIRKIKKLTSVSGANQEFAENLILGNRYAAVEAVTEEFESLKKL